MRQGTLFALGITRYLLGLYQLLVIVGILCNISNGDYVVSGILWFGITCLAQLAILGLGALVAGQHPGELQ